MPPSSSPTPPPTTDATAARQSSIWPAYRCGVLDGAPFLLMIIPFGLLFGVVATEAGLSILQTMAATVLVIAGASQFTAVALLTEQAPTLIVVFTALAVNLRMALYSAGMATHLGDAPIWKRAIAAYLLVDQAYAACAIKYEQEMHWSTSQKFAYEVGVMTFITPLWYGSTLVGALAGSAIPPEYGLDFAVPLCFLAIVAPLMRSLPNLVAALAAVAVSLALVALPYSLNVIVGGVVGMCAGAATEILQERRRYDA